MKKGFGAAGTLFGALYGGALAWARWGDGVALLRFFLAHGWMVAAGAGLLAAVARRFLAGATARPVSSVLFVLLLKALVFDSRLFPGGAAPTLLFVLTFLFVASLLVLFALDPLLALVKHGVERAKTTGRWRPVLGYVLAATLGFLAFRFLFPRAAAQNRAWIAGHFYWLTLLLPLAAGLLRRRFFARPLRYVVGLALLATGWVLLRPFLDGARHGALFFFFTVPWVHVYWEELIGFFKGGWEAWKRAEVEGGREPWARAARWTALARDRFGSAAKAREALAGTGRALDRWGGALWARGAGALAGHRTGVRRALVTLGALAVLIPAGRFLYRWTHVTVVEFTPKGQVADRVAIRVAFSGEVKPRLGDARRLDCFKITPPLEGSYRQDSPTSVVFVPAGPLKPSTRYRVEFDGTGLVSTAKRVQGSASTEFHTEFFNVTGARVYYNVDALTAQDMEVVGEVTFNHPVALDILRRDAKVTKDDLPLPVFWERALEPTRFYFRSEGVKPAARPQKIRLFLPAGLPCVDGTEPLEKDYETLMALPEKPKPQVTEVRLWHEPGNTLVSVLFNTPISKEQVARHLFVDPPLPLDIQTEYAMALLRGPFKPNVNYRVYVSSGLVAKSGERMPLPHTAQVRIADLPPSIAFARRGNILSLSGPQVLAVKTVNLDTVGVRISKIFRNNLLPFLNNEYGAPFAKQVYDGVYRVESGEINEEVSQRIGLAAFQKEPYKGLFQVEVYDPKEYYRRETGWFLCTDLGLVAKQSGDDLWVWAVTVKDVRAAEGVKVDLMSDTNQAMDSQVTDAAGRAVFENWRKHPYKFNPYFLVARREDDFSFLFFQRTEKNAYQFPIGGDPFQRTGLEAFLTPERGVYRPGETAFLTTVVRTADRQLPPDVPVQLVVTDPRGTEYARTDARLNANGMYVFNVAFPLDALTGAYDVRLEQPGVPRPLGSTSLKVEEFIPDKLKVAVAPPAEDVAPGQPLTFTVRARQMFGPPAVNHRVVSTVRFYSRIFSAPAYPDYVFQDANRSFSDESVDLGDAATDEKGEKVYALPIPEMKPPSALRAYIYSEVFDSGGRPVSAAGTVDVHVYPHYLGLKLDAAGPRRVGQDVKFNLLAVDPAGRPVTVEKARVVIRRKSWYSIFRAGSWGRNYYQSASYEEVVLNEMKDLPAKPTASVFKPTQEGEYTVLLVGPSGVRSSVTVNILGSGSEPANLQTPQNLQIVLDKEDYKVGEEVTALVRAPFPGKLFLTIERERVYETRVIEMTGRETTVRLPVKPDYIPNMYVVGLIVRPPDDRLDTLPMESFGVVPLSVETKARAIPVAWDTPTVATSADGIDVALSVDGDPARTNVVLAAVDEGVLQVTGFETPDPLAFFYRKNGLTTQTYSLMDLLLPDLEARKLALGGGDGGEFTRRHLNPVQAKKKKSMAVVSGLLSPDAAGRVRWHVDTPGFNGEVRVMALVVRGDRFGSAARSVEVADPIVLQPSFPRFAAPGDEFQVPVDVFNKTGRAGTFTVTLKTEGPVATTASTQKVDLAKDGQTRIAFPLRAAADAGVAKITIIAQGNDKTARTVEELSVRPAASLQTVMKQGALQPGASVELDVPGGFIPFGQRLRLNLSANPMFRYLGALDQLIAYPYGCAEQTTSQAFPLLYLKDLGFSTGRFGERANAIDTHVQGAVDRLQKLQLPNGEFSFWPGGRSGGRWLTYYVSHFLIEAQSQGYRVNPVVMSRLRTLLTKGVVEIPWEDIQEMAEGRDDQVEGEYEGDGAYESEGEEAPPAPLSAQLAADMAESRLDRRGREDQSRLALDPYLLYLKALLGQPDRESMTVVAGRKPDQISETERALLSLAYSRLGDKGTALKLLTPDFKSRWLYRQQFGDFNSPARNTALYLAALAEADPASPRVTQIVDYLGGLMKNGHFGSTQENAWALMALGRAFAASNAAVKVAVTANGQPYRTLEGRDLSVADVGLTGKKLKLTNTGAATAYYHLMAEGTPLAKATKPRAAGLSVTRVYRDVQGREVNLSNVPQGELVVVSLLVTAAKEARNVVVVDLLPGGFEIENPRLRSRGDLGFDPPGGFNAAYQDIRDDRILLFTEGFTGERAFSYAVRAVTPGRYVVPNPFAEAMYDPDVRGEGSEDKPLVVADVKP